jgi:hypothetical protein
LQTNEISEVNNFIPQNDIFKDSEIVLDSALPIYHTNKGSYIWYKDSIPTEIHTGKLSHKFDVLYQSIKPTAYKSQLKMYVSAYTACLTVIILIMLSFVFLPEAIASLHAGKSTAYVQDESQSNVMDDRQPEGKAGVYTVEGLSGGNLGFRDQINNVIYVNLPNGKVSIQESSWNTEEKGLSRVAWLKSLGRLFPEGSDIETVIEKVDLLQNGVWYRTMIGEFASITDAIAFAEQIRAIE